MTLYQIKMITASDKELGGKVKMTRAEAAAFLQSRGKTLDPRYFGTPKKDE